MYCFYQGDCMIKLLPVFSSVALCVLCASAVIFLTLYTTLRAPQRFVKDLKKLPQRRRERRGAQRNQDVFHAIALLLLSNRADSSYFSIGKIKYFIYHTLRLNRCVNGRESSG
jgi:hypothetical protein